MKFIFILAIIPILSNCQSKKEVSNYASLNEALVSYDSCFKNRNCNELHYYIREQYFKEDKSLNKIILDSAFIKFNKSYYEFDNRVIRDRQPNNCIISILVLKPYVESQKYINMDLEAIIDSLNTNILLERNDSIGLYGSSKELLGFLFEKHENKKFKEIFDLADEYHKASLISSYSKCHDVKKIRAFLQSINNSDYTPVVQELIQRALFISQMREENDIKKNRLKSTK